MGIGGLNGKTLAQAVKFGYGWYLLQRHMMRDDRDAYAAIMAEIERQKTYMNWCYKCDIPTLHTNDKGCLDCANGPAPSLEDELGPEWSVEKVVARMEAGK